MGGLTRQAQLEAQVRYAPQMASLSAALSQAIADRNSAIHEGAAAYKGISHAIHLAGSDVKHAYGHAKAEGKANTAIAQDQLARIGAVATPFTAAMAREGAVGADRLASSAANAAKDLSDRRIEAAAGRAYSGVKARNDYLATSGKIQTQLQSVAGQAGAFAQARLGELVQHKQDQAFQQSLQEERLTSQANLQGERLASSERVAGSRIAASSHNAALGRRQQKLGRQNSRFLQNQRLAATGPKGGGPKPTADTTFKGRQAIQGWVDQYAQAPDMSSVAGKARKQGVPSPIYNAAADLHSKGYISPNGVRSLAQIGVVVPKEWTGVQVRPHTRKRRGG